MTIKLLLLKNETDVGYADKSVKRWDACIPSNHALAAMCANKGIKCVYHAELVPEEHYQDYTKQVANTLKILSNCFCSDCPKDLKNIILAELARKLYIFELFLRRRDLHNEMIFYRDQGKIKKLNDAPESNVEFSRYASISKTPKDSYELDFQSPSGTKTKIFKNMKNAHRLRFSDPYTCFLHKYKNNKKKIIHISLSKKHQIVEILDKKLLFDKLDKEHAQFINNYVETACKVFFGTYNSLVQVFRNKPLPSIAYFNFIKDARMAACIKYFSDKGVITNFQSQGAIHTFGSEDQKVISEILAQGTYNNSPSARNILVRSQLQIGQSNDKKIKIKRTILPLRRKKTSETFKILIAPNFTNWADTPWGLHSTCFDIHETLLKLGSLVMKTPHFHWTYRLKYSLSDIPKASELASVSGLDPSQIIENYSKIKNITNVSHSSYDQSIKSTDLVITEGLTTVAYDAWESRKPVLFLRKSNNIRGLQRRFDESSTQFAERSPYHSISVENLTTTHLIRLGNLYWNRELTDKELSGVLNLQKL